MNEFHDANQQRWEQHAERYQYLRGDTWQQCIVDPTLGLERETLKLLDRFIGRLVDKNVCLLASGDNYAAFALAGLGAHVTSVDFSQRQLQIAAKRAKKLKLTIEFIHADVIDLHPIDSNQFDLVCHTNGVMVWIATPTAFYAEAHRILKPNGIFLSYDIHPFQRPWTNYPEPFHMYKPYFKTDPINHPYHPGTDQFYDQPDDLPPHIRQDLIPAYNFHWTISDLLNALIACNLELLHIREEPATDSSFWHTPNTPPAINITSTNWRQNPRAGLPAWITLVARKK